MTATPDIGTGSELGGGRYRLLAQLGKGGFGEVYRARDRRLGLDVAVKVLLNVEPGGLLRFKREFRALADVTHPNLVDLYEMHHQTRTASDPWFFSMELVDGNNILDALASDNLVMPLPGSRPSGRPATGTGDETRALPSGEDATASTPVRHPARPWRAPDYRRLQPALRQLVEGLAHLHASGNLHCDVKPSNVLVEAGGRVVVLDFGLVAEVGGAADDFVIGTPAYMSPEQAAGRPLTPASDWYAVGVMLYELLTGQRPFDAQGDEVLTLKQHVEPPSPLDRVTATYATDLASKWPHGLEPLCSALLARRPGDRPTAPDILAMLGAAGRATVSVPAVRWNFVGRERELATLHEAASDSREAPSVAVVSGASGVGKTSLMEAFLAATPDDAVVLRGRCYETESVPYPGLDEVVDALARWLGALDDSQRAPLIPDDLDALVCVFPVLGSLREGASNTGPAPDPNQLAQRASAAFRELIARICATRPVVVFVDDVQWADLDTHKLLTELATDASDRVLLVLGCRDAEQARFIDGTPGEVKRLHLEPLDDASAMKLIERQIRDPAEAELLVREAGGNPFLLTELARHRVESGTRRKDLSLRAMMEARLAELTEPARALLRTLAVAGNPLTAGVAGRAALVDEQDIPGAVKLLRARHLIRTSATSEQRLELYHDRARTTLAALVDDQAQAKIHGRLADTLFRRGSDDREAMALHCQRAGRTPEAAVHLSAAATRAMDVLAFERAAELLRLAIELGGGSHPLRVRRAEALAAAGRGAEAAAAYDLAAQDVDGARRLTLQWASVNQLFVSGRITESFERGGSLMRALGIKVIENHATAALGVLYHRVRLRVRGTSFQERDPESLTPMERLRLDAGYSVAMGVAMVDPIIGAAYQGRNLADALRFGDPARIARALVYEASYSAAISEDGWDRGQSMLTRVEGIAERGDDPTTKGYLLLGHGHCHYLTGDFVAAIPRLQAAADHMRTHCPDKRWEQVYARSLTLDALRWLGRWEELIGQLPPLIDDARRRGDVFAEALWQVKRIWAAIRDDDPESGRRGFEDSMSRWRYRGSPFQRYWLAVGRGELELYAGRAEAAHAEIEQPWSLFRRALLLQIPLLAAEAWLFRARAALAVAAIRGPDRALLRLVRRAADKLEATTMRTPWLSARASMLRAAEAMARDDRTSAIVHLRSASTVAQQTEQKLAVAAIDVRLAQLGLGDLEAALGTLTDAGFEAPLRFVSSELPGAWPG